MTFADALARLGGLVTAGSQTLSSAEDVVDPAIASAFGINTERTTVTRAEAMRVPAMRRARQLICGTIASFPLAASRTYGGRTVELGVPLLAQPERGIPYSASIAWLVDDLLFYGRSWWRVVSRDASDFPTTVERITHDRVTIATSKRDPRRLAVYVDNVEQADRDLIRIDGQDQGVLYDGGDALRTALDLQQAARNSAADPIPHGHLTPKEGAQPPKDPKQLLDDWKAARRARATAYLNSAVAYETHQFSPKDLQLVDARMFQVAEVARLTNVKPGLLGGTTGTGMTYNNALDDRHELVDTTLRQFTKPIGERLSMNDVTPNGTAVEFDPADFLELHTTLQETR